MAEVFLARSFGAEGIEKQLVIKKILPEFSQNRRFVDMFIAEAKIAMGLNHPNIVQIYDFGKVAEDYYLAMEYVDGVNVAQLLSACQRSGQPLSIGDAIYIGIELAKGLDYAHRRQDRYGQSLELVHRDISPQNILISIDGTVKIVDFGIAKATSVTDDGPSEMKGKYSYMSPEQASGGVVDQRSDLFSLGVVLFEMVCGRSLFRQSTPEQTLSLVKSAVVPDIASLNRNIPGPLEHLLYKALARLPADRYSTARELQLDLTRVLYSLGELYDGVTTAAHLKRIESFLYRGETAELSLESEASEARTVATHATHLMSGSGGRTHIPTETSAAEPRVTRRRKEVVILAGSSYGLMELREKVGAERWRQVFQEYKRIVDAIAYKNDGVVHRLEADGFVLLLGIPVSSENDAERAAYMAMDLHEAVAGMSVGLESPIHLGIGIALGEVVLEQEPGRARRRYGWTFYGASNEIAEGLSGAAFAREVLLGSYVYRRVHREFHCTAVDEVRVSEADGSSYLVQSFRLESPKSSRAQIEELRSSYQSVYGREITRKVLRTMYRQTLLDKKVSGVVIVGATGLGKSILVDDFLAGLDRRDVRIVRGVVMPFEQHIPLGSAAWLVSAILRLGRRDDLRLLYEKLEATIRSLFGDREEHEILLMLHALGSLFNLTFAGSEFDGLSGDERKKRIFVALRRVILRVAEEKPLVLAFDDAHCTDPMTLRGTVEFFRSHPRAQVFLVCTASDTDSLTKTQEWQDLVGLESIRVEPLRELNEGEAEMLVREMLGVHGVSEDRLVTAILRYSGGNPLYIKEVIDGLKNRGWLADRKGVTAAEAIEADPEWLPVSVEGLIGSRIDRLELVQKVVLQRVALLWPSFTLGDARLVVDEQVAGGALKSDEEGTAVFDKLVEDGFLVRSDARMISEPDHQSREEVTYRFCNLLTQDVAARGLIPEESAMLCRRLAGLLQGVRERLGLRGSVMIARYFESAGDHALAMEYYREAAEEAFEHLGAAECVRLCDQLLEKNPGDDQRIKVLLLLQGALHEAGEQERNVRVLDELYERVFPAGQPDEQLEVLLRLSRHHYERSSLRVAREFLEQAQQIGGACNEVLSQAKLWQMEAVLAIAEGQSERALGLLERVIDIYADNSPGSLDRDRLERLGAAENIRGVIFRQSGRHEEALLAYERALEYARAGNNRRQIHMLLLNSGLALVYLHKISEALEHYEAALEQCRRLGHIRGQAGLLVNMGHAYYLQGENNRAIASLEKGIGLGQKLAYNQIVADGQISLGVCFLATGALEAAENALHEGLRLADSIPHPYLSIHATLALARVNLVRAQGEGEAARDAAKIALMQAEDALERSDAARMAWGEAVALSLMARALHLLGRVEGAIAYSRRAVAMLDAGEEFDKEEILYFHYRIVSEAGHREEGIQALMRSHASLLKTGNRIADVGDRMAFMDRPIHQEIATAYREESMVHR